MEKEQIINILKSVEKKSISVDAAYFKLSSIKYSDRFIYIPTEKDIEYRANEIEKNAKKSSVEVYLIKIGFEIGAKWYRDLIIKPPKT